MFTRGTMSRSASPPVTGGMPKAGGRHAIAAMAALVALAAAGCGSASSPAGGSSPAVSVTGARPSPGSPSPQRASGSAPAPAPGAPAAPSAPATAGCTGWPSAPAGPLPASFTPVSVLRCVTGDTQVPGQGEWLTATLEKADQNLTPLVQALRAPDGQRQRGQMCPMYAMVPPAVVLVGADGTSIQPRFPVTGCGQIQPQVLTALNALSWHTVSQRLVEKAPANQ